MANVATDQFLVTYMLDAVAGLKKNIEPMGEKLKALEERLNKDDTELSDDERKELYQWLNKLIHPTYDFGFALRAFWSKRTTRKLPKK